MPEQPTASAEQGRRGWWTSVAVVCAVILFRSGVFVFWERAQFDSDQAVMGLMAKHLAEGRAFPLFLYGQNYILGIEAWLAAPLFMLAGASVTTLKLPLLAINIATGVLLLRVFTRDVGLRPSAALVATLFFALPAAGTAARLVDAGGGNVEPFLYIVLIWILRRRPVWCGAVLGLGFLQREFTLYGFGALLVVETLRRDLFTRVQLSRKSLTIGTAALVWLTVQGLKRFSSGAGPGTTIADVYGPANNLGELAARSCFHPASIGTGLHRIVTDHWPTLFGTAYYRLTDFSIESHAGTQGMEWSWCLLAAIVLVALLSIAVRSIAARTVPRDVDFCAYLVATGLLSVGGYVVGRCGEIGFYFMRYELLSVLALVGLAGWFLRIVPDAGLIHGVPNLGVRTLALSWLSLAIVWFMFTAIPHARLWHEYLTGPPADVRREVIAKLDARGIRYASSTYWISYAITFLTNERIIMKSDDFVRIREYERIVDQHRDEAWRVTHEACGEEIMRRLYLCR